MSSSQAAVRRVVLYLEPDRDLGRFLVDDRVTFSTETDPRVIPDVALRMLAADFRALGGPDRITVTITAGDESTAPQSTHPL
jgi:hypothetical protein